MSQAELDKGKELINREVIRGTKLNTSVVMHDGLNTVQIPGYPYIFEARRDNLLVSIDVFKSGYECRECGGLGELTFKCECEDHDRPGYKYSSGAIKEATQTMGSSVGLNRENVKCPTCEGNYLAARKTEKCSACNGNGALIYIPDQSKLLPTTGVVVSKGPDVKDSKIICGSRILFGSYSGTMIPTKVPGVSFKVIREVEILLIIEGGEEGAAFDFITVDKD